MKAPFKTAQSPTLSNLPAEFASLSVSPLMLPGESLEKYELMRQAIFADLAPRTAIEWLLAIDVVELSWEIQRYRVLRHKLLDHHREMRSNRSSAILILPNCRQRWRTLHATKYEETLGYGEQTQPQHAKSTSA